MRYIEITASVASADAERAAVVLREITGGGASIELPFSQPDLESDAEPGEGTAQVRSYASSSLAAIETAARDSLTAEGIVAAVSVSSVEDADWANAWKEHFHVERFGERLVVVPSWREHEPREGDVVLRLDPGMAFGTGQHETTRMCLEALERVVRPGDVVLDVGCGSGILSIAAAKVGAARVMAVDIDPDCVRITRENTALNDVAGVIDAREGSLGVGQPSEVPVDAACDVVVANIVARVIVDLAHDIVCALREGGTLIASGVIGERESMVFDALSAAGLRIEGVRAMGDWRCIEARKAAGV